MQTTKRSGTIVDDSTSVSILLFRMGPVPMAFILDAVRQVFDAVDVGEPPGQLPQDVIGLINVGGQKLPLVDIRRRWGLPSWKVQLNNQIVVVECGGTGGLSASVADGHGAGIPQVGAKTLVATLDSGIATQSSIGVPASASGTGAPTSVSGARVPTSSSGTSAPTPVSGTGVPTSGSGTDLPTTDVSAAASSPVAHSRGVSIIVDEVIGTRNIPLRKIVRLNDILGDGNPHMAVPDPEGILILLDPDRLFDQTELDEFSAWVESI